MDDAKEWFLWILGSGFVLLLFVWILKIEPYVRRRTRTSALFFLPWAPWQDYFAGVRLVNRYPSVPWFFPFFRWLTYFEIIGFIVAIALWVGW